MCKEYIWSILPAALPPPTPPPMTSTSSLSSLMGAAAAAAAAAPDVFLSHGLDAGSALCKISRLKDSFAFSFCRSSRRSRALEACVRGGASGD